MSLKTSIILCTYNEVHHIKNTIAQIQKAIEDLELIIVDDNSTDGTTEIINKLVSKFKNVYHIKRSGKWN